jgi:hypothetical protein
MPGGDKTGPLGMGPISGRGAGYCTGNDVPGFANMGGGFGRRMGGRGWRHRFYATGIPGWARGGYGYDFESFRLQRDPRIASRDELNRLRDQANQCESTLKAVNARIEELERHQKDERKE